MTVVVFDPVLEDKDGELPEAPTAVLCDVFLPFAALAFAPPAKRVDAAAEAAADDDDDEVDVDEEEEVEEEEVEGRADRPDGKAPSPPSTDEAADNNVCDAPVVIIGGMYGVCTASCPAGDRESGTQASILLTAWEKSG